MTGTGLRCRLCCVLAVAGLLLPLSAEAANVTFQIDPSLSSVGLAGSFGAIPLFPQAAGADVTSYGGTIVVDVDNPLAPSSIGFVSGGTATANINGNWLPNDVLGCGAGENCGGDDPNTILGDADPGDPAPGNYGLAVVLTSSDIGLPPDLGEATAYAAVRGLSLSLTAGAVPIVGGAFASTQMLNLESGSFDSNINSTLPTITGLEDSAGTDDLAGDMADGPNSAENGSYSVLDKTATLTVPVEFLFSDSVNLALSGVLVATHVVPEPSGVWLLAIGASILTGLVIRRHGRQ